MAKVKADQTSSILEYALRHLEAERDDLQAKIDHVRKQLGKRPVAVAEPAAEEAAAEAPAAKGKKRVLSASARKRIALAQKKRWAEHRKAKEKA